MSAIPKGSLVLVTGANGYIASHIIDQLLQAGFAVRGTVREEWKGDWLKQYVAKHYPSAKLHIVVVPDMSKEGAFDTAVEGITAFIHVASDLTFSSDPNAVIPPVVAAIKTVTTAALTQPTFTHFIYTSSSAAVAPPIIDTPFTITANMFNETSVAAAWASVPEKDPFRAAHVYSASKVAAEKAVWEFAASKEVQERKPKVVVNSVVPNMNYGPILSPPGVKASSGDFVPGLYKQGLDGLQMFRDFPPQFHIDVRDTARLHVAPLLDPTIANERLFGMNEVFDNEKLLKIVHELRPEWKNEEVWEEKRKVLVEIEPRGRAIEVLKKVFGRDGFVGLRESVEANLEGVV